MDILESSARTKVGVLVVDDDATVRKALVDLLGGLGYAVVGVGNAEEALRAVQQLSVDLVLTDLRLPGIGGIELLGRLQRIDDQLLGIVLTGNGTITHAVQAMKAGAFDFITKPFDLEEVEESIQCALESRQLKEKNQRLQVALRDKCRFENIGRNSMAMGLVYELVEKVADADNAIMIVGESGTGKELAAQAIHYNSHRSNNPLISVNCRLIHEHLLERELFGRERGAFTGSAASYMGRFDSANGGTIFLDEVAGMSLPLQVKLLRVIQEGVFERVGGNRTVHVDVRVIAATNRNLEQAVTNKQFHNDLYRRLQVMSVAIPPLRERVADISLLVDRCLEKFKWDGGISPEAIRLLEQYSWPGNVRELENELERIVTLKRRGMIEPEDISVIISRGGAFMSQPASNNAQDVQATLLHATPDIETRLTWEGGIDLSKSVDEFETSLIVEALRRSKGVKSRAAKLLCMNRTTLVEKLKKKGISKSSF